MTRRALFARLAGLLGVPYVAKALPVPAKVTSIRAFEDVYLRAAVQAIAADIDKRAMRFHRDAFVMTWPKAATRGIGLSDIFKGEPL